MSKTNKGNNRYKNRYDYSKNAAARRGAGKNSNSVLIAFICIVSLAIVVVAVIIGINLQPSKEFVPPKFDSQASVGMPTVADNMGYREVYMDGMSFSSYVCGEVNIVNGKADIYFTNPEKNTLWMKLRIFDAAGNVIAETGLIKPNEYIKTVNFDKIPSNNSTIIMKIMSYEPDTYYSGGAVTLSTVAKVK